jgi:hypothetical protein
VQARRKSVEATILPKSLLSGKKRSALIEIGIMIIEANVASMKKTIKNTNTEGMIVIKIADTKILLFRSNNEKNENSRKTKRLKSNMEVVEN